MHVHRILATAACVALAGPAGAALIVVDAIGGPVNMYAGNFPGLLVPGSNLFTEDEMQSVHASLGAAGIETDDYVTFLLAETGAGLAFMTLIDSNIVPPGGGVASSIAMSTTGPNTMSRYVNAEAGDSTEWIDQGNGLQTFNALWNWDSGGEADGFAWGDLTEGDAVSYNFYDTGADGLNPEPFQFLSYNGGDWQIVATGDWTVAGQFVFSFTTIPGPGAFSLMGLAGLLMQLRRRR